VGRAPHGHGRAALRRAAEETPSLYLITGIMAAGKSTVAQALAERLSRSVHLRGDVFRRMIVSGRVEMGFELTREAERQLALRYRLAATTAELYLEAGFSVVYQDIILGRGLTEVLAWLPTQFPLYLVVLCPAAEVAAARDRSRAKTAYTGDGAQAFDAVLREETPRLGLWLDTSELTVAETVDGILSSLPSARVR
jgi:predicted kinase